MTTELRSLPNFHFKFNFLHGQVKHGSNTYTVIHGSAQLTECGIRIHCEMGTILPQSSKVTRLSGSLRSGNFSLQFGDSVVIEHSAGTLTSGQSVVISPLKVIIQKTDQYGNILNIKKPERIFEVYNGPRIAGSTFDQFGHSSINKIDRLVMNGRLYSTSNGIGNSKFKMYSLLPCKGDYRESIRNSIALRDLLSFAFGDRVFRPYKIIYDSNYNYKIEWFSSQCYTGHPTLYVSYPMELQEFLRNGILNHRKLSNYIQFNLLIEYFVHLKKQTVAEFKWIMISVFFELLKDQYAGKIKNYDQAPGGKYLHQPNLINRFLKKVRLGFLIPILPFAKRKSYSFKGLIIEALDHFRVKHNSGYIDTLVGYRNQVIHTGDLRVKSKHKIDNIKAGEKLAERVLLTVLEHTGYWFSNGKLRKFDP